MDYTWLPSSYIILKYASMLLNDPIQLHDVLALTPTSSHTHALTRTYAGCLLLFSVSLSLSLSMADTSSYAGGVWVCVASGTWECMCLCLWVCVCECVWVWVWAQWKAIIFVCWRCHFYSSFHLKKWVEATSQKNLSVAKTEINWWHRFFFFLDCLSFNGVFRNKGIF